MMRLEKSLHHIDSKTTLAFLSQNHSALSILRLSRLNIYFFQTIIQNNSGHTLSDFKILNKKQIKHIQLVDPALLSLMIQHGEKTELYTNELLKVRQPNTEQVPYWFPTCRKTRRSNNIHSKTTKIIQRSPRAKRTRETNITRELVVQEINPHKLRLVRYNTRPRRSTGRSSLNFLTFCQTWF